MSAKKRIEVFDWARAVAIMSVVTGHSYVFGINNASFPNAVTALFLHQGVTFSVALFMYLIGYFMARTNLTLGAFWKRRAVRIVPPYLVWAAIAAVGTVMIQGGRWTDVIFKVLTFTASGQHYFIFLVLVFYTFYPLFKRMDSRWSGYFAVISFVANLLWVGYAEFVQWRVDISEISIVKGGLLTYMNPLCWVGFFAFGLWAGKKGVVVPFRKIATTWWYPLIVFSFYLFAVVEMILFWGLKGYIVAFDLFKPLSILWEISSIPLILALLEKIPRGRFGAWLARYGRLSYGVYLSHLPMMWWVWHALNVTTGSYLLDRFFVNLIGVFLSYAILELLHRIPIVSNTFVGLPADFKS